ncbi:MAG: phosphopantothenoylcysteine decarboxylase [Tepidisphaeraceae bacterium]|jgi:phosphopantothenoylcysteine decarboxylase/phosphopantothenate--cysteine ligase
MRILITAGPTFEPIDPVRFIGNRSSGKMGAALVKAAVKGGNEVTLIAGPVSTQMPKIDRRIDVEDTEQMLQAVQGEFPQHDLLIMAAAVADFRPKAASRQKIDRADSLTLELEPTQDILATLLKRWDQRTVGFSLETGGNFARARRKLVDKKLDLMVYNPVSTLGSQTVTASLLYPDGREEKLPTLSKTDFADILLQKSIALFGA